MQHSTASSSHRSWIPIRVDLHSAPEVVRLARLSNRNVDEIVGLLVRFWSWASENSADGILRGLHAMDVALASHVPVEFLCAMAQAGWLCVAQDGTISIPKFDRWLARNRPERNNVSIEDDKPRHACNGRAHGWREQHQAIDWSKVAFPGGCDTPEVRQAILEWMEYRRKIKKKYVDPERQVSMLLKRFGVDICEAIRHSIAQGYQGCFMPSSRSSRSRVYMDDLYGADPL